MGESAGAKAVAFARWQAERAAERRLARGTVACPVCGEEMVLTNPSVADRKGWRLAGCWCLGCVRAWRALWTRKDGWRVVWDVGLGETVYVLNGRLTTGDGCGKAEGSAGKVGERASS